MVTKKMEQLVNTFKLDMQDSASLEKNQNQTKPKAMGVCVYNLKTAKKQS